jgi:hypothetical protein
MPLSSLLYIRIGMNFPLQHNGVGLAKMRTSQCWANSISCVKRELSLNFGDGLAGQAAAVMG